MTVANDELEMLLTRDGLRPASTRTTTIDEVARAYARLPMNKEDHRALLDGLIARVKIGRRISPMPLDAEFKDATREDYRDFIQAMAPRGLAFVTAWDLETGLMIVKTDAGRSFFGKQRASFACFISNWTGALDAAGVMPSIADAFGVLDSLYRIQERVERDFG